ncbi:hypothetical protein [Gymnodinialimonas hymeniacidonis]|uniref:hypothetical protein n=1 Tax=Gymnodinialimonas hymeniacidonis TaxID=3126508 RepID=UPI0034C615E7
MSAKQGLFESDEAFRDRMELEANEKTISQSTGSEPSQGFFESDRDYSERVAKEADEYTISGNTGSPPRQGLFESESDYRYRLEEEANESIINHSTENSPRQGLFENDTDYNTRVRKEANQRILNEQSDETYKRGLFESDYEYRRRIDHAANISQILTKPKDKTRYRHSTSYNVASQTATVNDHESPGTLLFFGIIAVSVAVVFWVLRTATPVAPPLDIEVAAYQNGSTIPSPLFGSDVGEIQIRARLVSGSTYPEDFQIVIRYPNGDIQSCAAPTCPVRQYEIRTIELGPSLFAPNRAGRDRVSIAFQAGWYTIYAHSDEEVISQTRFQVRG